MRTEKNLQRETVYSETLYLQELQQIAHDAHYPDAGGHRVGSVYVSFQNVYAKSPNVYALYTRNPFIYKTLNNSVYDVYGFFNL